MDRLCTKARSGRSLVIWSPHMPSAITYRDDCYVNLFIQAGALIFFMQAHQITSTTGITRTLLAARDLCIASSSASRSLPNHPIGTLNPVVTLSVPLSLSEMAHSLPPFSGRSISAKPPAHLPGMCTVAACRGLVKTPGVRVCKCAVGCIPDSPHHLPQLPHTKHPASAQVPPRSVTRFTEMAPENFSNWNCPHDLTHQIPWIHGFSPDRPEPSPTHKPVTYYFYCRDAAHNGLEKDRLRRDLFPFDLRLCATKPPSASRLDRRPLLAPC